MNNPPAKHLQSSQERNTREKLSFIAMPSFRINRSEKKEKTRTTEDCHFNGLATHIYTNRQNAAIIMYKFYLCFISPLFHFGKRLNLLVSF